MITIVPATKTDLDGQLIMKWRNDPDTLQNSFNKLPKEWSTFKDEYYHNYFKNIPLFASIDDTKYAFVSFVYHNDSQVKIGINLAPEHRGKGLSKKIVRAAIDYLKETYPEIKTIQAFIKEYNTPSIRLFEGLGFELQNDSVVKEFQLSSPF